MDHTGLWLLILTSAIVRVKFNGDVSQLWISNTHTGPKTGAVTVVLWGSCHGADVIGPVVLRGSCPLDNCPWGGGAVVLGIVVLYVAVVPWTVVLGGSCPRDCCPTWQLSPGQLSWGGGSCPRDCCPTWQLSWGGAVVLGIVSYVAVVPWTIVLGGGAVALGPVVLRGSCPLDKCPGGVVLGIDVLRGSCPLGKCPWGGAVVLGIVSYVAVVPWTNVLGGAVALGIVSYSYPHRTQMYVLDMDVFTEGARPSCSGWTPNNQPTGCTGTHICYDLPN